MLKILCFYLLIILLPAGCSLTNSTRQETPTIVTTSGAVIAPTSTAVETPPSTLNAKRTPTYPTPSSPTSIPTTKSTTISSTIKPVIHKQPGDNYEILISISVDQNSSIQYEILTQAIEGPNAIAVLPDDSFLIADPVGDQLLRYDQTGHLLKIMDLDELGIGYIRDLRVKGNEIFLLETSYQKYRVHRLTIDGSLVASEEIPYGFPVDAKEKDYTLENALTGIAIDCDDRIVLEVTSGSRLFPLSEVQKQSDSSHITQGLLCNGKRYFVSRSGPWIDPQVSAGEFFYQTYLTYGLGGLNYLNLFQDGSIYIVRNDVVTDPVITVDKTVHYIGADGVVQGVARVPLSEFFYPVMRSAAVNAKGEVFVLLPRKDSLDVVRLNFYTELGPLIPGAEIPQITMIPNNP